VRSIRERLNAMQPEAPAQSVAAPPGVPIDLVTPGVERITSRGRHFLVETHSDDPTGGLLTSRNEVLPSSVRNQFASTSGTKASDILFLDTETTGLDRGTGTHVFLVGIGFYNDDRFQVQQHFLRDLHEEASLLCALEQIISEFSVLVTFNGRGFDWPLISNRFILHGYRDIPELAHWDLLTSSRRVWRNRLRDCSLGNLERELLAVQRYGDVPGYLIPSLYFDYLRSRDARPLRPIFSHNHEDIVSLARLADLLLSAENDPCQTLIHPIDQLSYGLWLLSGGDLEQAEQLILPNLEHDAIDLDLRYRGYKSLADLHKRRGRWPVAMELWEEMRRQQWITSEQTLYPLVELAKVFEHRLRDYLSAIRLVEQALNLADIHGWRSEHASLIHRYARLQRRLSKNRPSSAL
jgi:uncharacterized protein